MTRHVIDRRAAPGPSRLVQFLRIARRAGRGTWHRPEAAPAGAAGLRAYWRIARGHRA